MSPIRQCADIKGTLLKYNNMIVHNKNKLTNKKYLTCHFKTIIRESSVAADCHRNRRPVRLRGGQGRSREVSRGMLGQVLRLPAQLLRNKLAIDGEGGVSTTLSRRAARM